MNTNETTCMAIGILGAKLIGKKAIRPIYIRASIVNLYLYISFPIHFVYSLILVINEVKSRA